MRKHGEDLLLLASKKDSSFLAFIEDVTTLTPYAVEIRYGESEAPLLEDAKKALTIAEKIKDFILARLPDEILKN